MNEEAGVRKKLKRAVRQELPEFVWEDQKLREKVEDYLEARNDADREDAWSILVEEAERLMRLVENAKAEALEGIESSITEGDLREREEASRGHQKEGGKLEATSFISAKTKAMLRAMSELFAQLAHQYPEVVEFRDKVLGGRLLTEDEAHNLLASYAARLFTLEQFSDWKIPVIGHDSELVEYDHGLDKDEIDHRATIRVDPPEATKTVRYAFPHGKGTNIRCVVQGERAVLQAVIPPNQRDAFAGRMPIVLRGGYKYPPFLWPGSVVDKLYDLAEELSDQFDWPDKDAATWFILTGKAPEVRPINARWETKTGKYLNPQWRIRLTIPPWLPEKEVLKAYRQMRGQVLEGTKLPKTTTPLEVARFVREQDRLNGYKRRSWKSLHEQWKEEHPGATLPTYNNFCTYFRRGDKAIKKLNFSWPTPGGNRV